MYLFLSFYYTQRRTPTSTLFSYTTLFRSFQHVPRFIVTAMKMRRGDQTRRTWGTTRVAPFGDHKSIVDRTEDLRSEEHTSELQSLTNLVCRLLLEKKNKQNNTIER